MLADLTAVLLFRRNHCYVHTIRRVVFGLGLCTAVMYVGFAIFVFAIFFISLIVT